MGGKDSTIKKQDWIDILHKDSFTVVQNRKERNLKALKYVFNSYEQSIDTQEIKKINQFRLKSPPHVVGIKGWDTQKNGHLCSQDQSLLVYTDFVENRLTSIKNLPEKRALELILDSLEGYQTIYWNTGKIGKINSEMICFDENWQIKVWINQKLGLCEPQIKENQKKGQSWQNQVIIDLINTFENHIEKQRFSDNLVFYLKSQLGQPFQIESFKTALRKYIKNPPPTPVEESFYPVSQPTYAQPVQQPTTYSQEAFYPYSQPVKQPTYSMPTFPMYNGSIPQSVTKPGFSPVVQELAPTAQPTFVYPNHENPVSKPSYLQTLPAFTTTGPSPVYNNNLLSAMPLTFDKSGSPNFQQLIRPPTKQGEQVTFKQPFVVKTTNNFDKFFPPEKVQIQRQFAPIGQDDYVQSPAVRKYKLPQIRQQSSYNWTVQAERARFNNSTNLSVQPTSLQPTSLQQTSLQAAGRPPIVSSGNGLTNLQEGVRGKQGDKEFVIRKVNVPPEFQEHFQNYMKQTNMKL